MSGCKTCGKKLGSRNKSGYCTKHVAAATWALPGMREKQSEGLRRKMALDPAYRDALIARARALAADPETTHRRTRHFVENRVWEAGKAAQTPEVRARAARSISAAHLAWCPPNLRSEYKELKAKNGLRKAEARRMIEDQHELEMARWRRSIGVVVEGDAIVIPTPAKPAKRPQDRAFKLATQLFEVTEDEIISPSREHRIMLARYALAKALQRAGWTTLTIADALNRGDHSTSVNLIQRAEVFIERDRAFASKVDQIAACWGEMEAAA